MPLDRNGYHTNFKIRGPECIRQAQGTCQDCGGKQGDEYIAEDGKTKKIVLQAAHINHDPWNPRAILRCLCKSCHLKYDGLVHGKNASRTKKRKDRKAKIDAGQQPLSFLKQKEPKTMKGRLDSEIRYNEEDSSYLFFDVENDERVTLDFAPESPKYHVWLDKLKSFHFQGKYGHFTARKEDRGNKDGTIREYWSVYRRVNYRQFRKYLGITGSFTIADMERCAKSLADTCSSQEQRVKPPRKNPEKRETLYARIEARDEIIEQLRARVSELEQELATLNAEDEAI